MEDWASTSDLHVWRIFCLLESQAPTITSAPSSPLSVVEGESVTLEWTYDIGGSGFFQAEFTTQGVPFIVDRFRQDPVAINSKFVGRLTANITETNASITFLAVNRSDSRTYDFRVQNENRESDTRALDIEVQCEWTDMHLNNISLLVITPVHRFESVRMLS